MTGDSTAVHVNGSGKLAGAGDQSPRARLRDIIQQQSVLHGDFVLASGRKSKVFFDIKKSVLDPEGANLIAEEMLDILHAIQPGANRVMLVGHNPEIQSFALDLVGSGAKNYRERLRAKYPTAALAVINFDAGLWKSIAVNTGSLSLFLTPKDVRG